MTEEVDTTGVAFGNSWAHDVGASVRVVQVTAIHKTGNYNGVEEITFMQQHYTGDLMKEIQLGSIKHIILHGTALEPLTRATMEYGSHELQLVQELVLLQSM